MMRNLLILFFTVFNSSKQTVQANKACRSPGAGFSNNTLLTIHSLEENSTCFDGSRAKYYYRPCCDGEDPLDFCNASESKIWFIIFEQNGWCYSNASCQSRRQEYKSSQHLPESFPLSTDGIFSIFGEQNPNFYKNYAVYVPHCSNDMFLGSCHDNRSKFCGQNIAKAVVKNLYNDFISYGATEVVFVGGPGIMHLVPLLATLLPDQTTARAICDGCFLPTGEIFQQVHNVSNCNSQNCTSS